MGHFGRITKFKDLPSDKTIKDWVRAAVQLNETGVQKTSPPRHAVKPPVRPPADFLAALKAQPSAARTFQDFSPSHQREYVEWITEAKREATRQRRLQTAIGWLAQGKSRNWKYERC